MASRCSRPVAFIVLFQTMVEIDRDFHSAASYEAAALSLVLLPLSIVNLSMFSIPLLSKMHSTILSAEMFCKVKANFSNHQIFREKFLIYFFLKSARPLSRSFASLSASAVVSFSKASAKLQHFLIPTKLFDKKFVDYFSMILWQRDLRSLSLSPLLSSEGW